MNNVPEVADAMSGVASPVPVNQLPPEWSTDNAMDAPRPPGYGRVSPESELVAVVAVVLVVGLILVGYLLLVGIGGGGTPPSGSPTATVAPAFIGEGTCGTGPSTTYNLSLNPSATVTTATFGMKIATPSGSIVSLGLQGTVGNMGDRCDPAPSSSWYGVLWSLSGVAAATFTTGGASGWSATDAGPLPVTVTAGMTLELVAGANATGFSVDTFDCYGIGGNSVVGSTSL